MLRPFFKSFIQIATEGKLPVYSESDINISLKHLQISCSEDFKAIFVKEDSGNQIGVIIGNPILDDAFLTSGFIVAAKNWTAFEDHIYSLTGRYIVLANLNNQHRLYLDASGSLPLVYDAEKKIVASSAAIILGEAYENRLNNELLQKMGMPKSGLWIPSGLTAHYGIHRIMPNHYLDLDGWKTERHWPVKEIVREDSTEKNVFRIISGVKKTCSAIAKTHTPVFSLTAGRDSRMLLACAKDITKQSEFFTFSKFPGSVDTHYAGKFSKEFNLNHQYLKPAKLTYEQKSQWLKWNGHCVSGEIWKLQHSLKYFSNHHAILPGMAGEVGRAFYWDKNDRENLSLTEKEFLVRLKLPQINELLEASRSYLNGLPEMDFFSVLDLVYIEQRLGCWGNVSVYTGNHYAPHFIPFSSREIFTSMMSLPVEYRRKQQLSQDIIQKEWPELLRYPFNNYQGVYKAKKYLEYAYLLPSYLYRKL